MLEIIRFMLIAIVILAAIAIKFANCMVTMMISNGERQYESDGSMVYRIQLFDGFWQSRTSHNAVEKRKGTSEKPQNSSLAQIPLNYKRGGGR